MHGEISDWRRDIHQNPELMFDVYRTSDFVATKLEEFGCDEIVRGIGRTGVVGIINGRLNTSGKTIGLRADMDALPIEEDTSVPYTSKTPGVMNACGRMGTPQCYWEQQSILPKPETSTAGLLSSSNPQKKAVAVARKWLMMG